LGLDYIKSLSDLTKAMTTVGAAAFSGGIFTFMQYLGNHSARGIYAYPLGLIVSLLWYYTRYAMGNTRSKRRSDVWLGVLHLIAASLLTVFAIALVVPPAIREMWFKTP
jgi:hypothetical protein